MQGTTQNYTLDMADERKKEPLRVKQGDTNSRWARVTLRAFGELWPIPDDCLVFISVKKTDGTVVQNDCTIEGPGVVLVPIAGQVTAIAGIQWAELYFLAEDGDIKSQTFPIQVLPMVMDQEVIESSNEFGALQSALLDAETASGVANDAAAEALIQADDAKAAAVQATEAAKSIDRAVQAASAAKTSETNAKASEAAAAQTKADVEALKEGFIGYDKIESGRRYANALTMTAEGEGQVVVTDAWNAPVVDMEIGGASEQVVTTGAQLLDIKLPSVTTKSGVTVSLAADGGIHLSGTATASGNHRLIDPAQNVSINCDSATLSLQASGAYDGVVLVADATEAKWKTLLSTTNNATSIGVVKTNKLGCYATYIAGTTYDVTLYPMLCAGTTALPWEPYTGGQAAPSPYYPQEIASTDVTEVTVTGENQSKAAAITLAKPLHGIGDVRDRITCKDGVWGVERCFDVQIFDGSSDEAWVAVLNNDGVNYRNGTSFIKSKSKANGAVLCTAFAKKDGVPNSLPGFKIAGDASIITYSEVYNTSDVSLWTVYLAEHPMTVIYELATPTWEPFPAETQTALNALTTHSGTTYLTVTSTDVAAPIRLEYVQDTRKVIDALQLDVAEQIVELQAQIDQLKVTNNLS